MTDQDKFNLDYSRCDLRWVLQEVKKHGGDNRAVGITCTRMGCNKIYFFEYVPADRSQRFVADVDGDNAYEARANGWREWLRQVHNVK